MNTPCKLNKNSELADNVISVARIHRLKPLFASTVACAFLLSAFNEAKATTYTWTSSTGAAWTNGTHWTGGGGAAAPDGSDIVTTGTGGLQVAGNHSIGNLTFDSSAPGNWTISGQNVTSGTTTLAITGALNVSSANTLNFFKYTTNGNSGDLIVNINNINISNGTIAFGSSTQLLLGESVTGTTTMSGGQIQFSTSSGSASLGFVSMTGAGGYITIWSPATTTTAGLTVNGLSGAAGTIRGTSNPTSGNTVTTTLTVNTTGSSSFGGLLVDKSGGTGTASMALIKTGAGSQTLTGSNTYSGGTKVQVGTLSINTVGTGSTAQSLGAGSVVNLGVANTSSGKLQYTGATGTLDKNITALGNGGDTIQNTGGGTLTLSGTLTKANTVLTLSGGAFNVSGKITGGSTSDFNSDLNIDGATVTLSGANNDYTGPTRIYNGSTLLNGVNNAMPTGTVLTEGTSTEGAVTNTYDLNGHDQSVAALNSVSNTAGNNVNIVTNSGASGVNTLTLTGVKPDGSAVGGDFGGTIQNGTHGASTAVTVTGGTQTLRGTNTYTGATKVTAGTLTIKGSLANTTTTVNNTGTLNGNGTIGGAVTSYGAVAGTLGFGSDVTMKTGGNLSGSHLITGALSAESGATIAPGTAAGDIGTITASTFSLASGAHLSLDINGTSAGTNADEIITTASNGCSLGGDLTLTIGSAYVTPEMGDALMLILNQGTGTVSTTFSSVNITVNNVTSNFSGAEGTIMNIEGQDFKLSYAAGTGNDVELLAVPEPSTWAMLVGGFGMLISFQKMRRRNAKA
jgi:autotransporter-associated beta strand protein